MIAIETFVKTVAIVVAIVIVIAGLFYIYNNYVYPAFNVFDFARLPSNVQQKVNDNWNSLIANIKSCYDIVDYDCLCSKGFPGFPTTFPSDFKIKFEGKNISLFFKNSRVNTIEFENFKASGFDEDKIKVTDEKRDINFRGVTYKGKGYLLFGDFYILNDSFYKPDQKTVTFVTNFTFWRLISTYIKPEEKFLKQLNGINQRPQCLQERSNTINKFNEFVICANSNQLAKNCQFFLKNADDYYIFIAKAPSAKVKVFLKYKDKIVITQYDLNLKKSVDVSADVPSSCSQDILISNGDSVKIVQEAGKTCLQKV